MGLTAVEVIKSFCPAEQMISGLCIAPWFSTAKSFVIVLFSGISAVFVIVSAYFLAPNYKVKVAVIALLLGVLVASYFFYESGAWLEYMIAIVCGVMATRCVSKIGGDRCS